MNIALLGSTGSIGKQVLEVVKHHKDRFNIVSLAADTSSDLLLKQVHEFKPLAVSLISGEFGDKVPAGVEVFTGDDALTDAVIEDADLVFIAVMGFCGLKAVLKAIGMGKRVALANKESLVAGGELIMPLAKLMGVDIIPVDSEHSALWQCLNFQKRGYKRLIITGSGGALRDVPVEKLPQATPRKALAHPNWKMGDKITIDCATMMNKGFEVIETHWLFNAPPEKIEVIIHPQSIIHAMVEFDDNSVLCEMANPDMAQPIQLALTYPEKTISTLKPLDLLKIGRLDFKPVDLTRYPCFGLALESMKAGGTSCCTLNAANEMAVKAFLAGKIKFTDIYAVASRVLERAEKSAVSEESLYFADAEARRIAAEIIG